MYILYVEDNQNDADLTRRYLARHAPQIAMDHARLYSDAMSKLALCNQDQPIYDLILTDMRLPDGDGIKVLTHVRSRGLPIPVIVLTGTGSEEMAVSALKSGAEDYITKRHDYLVRLPTLLENTLARFQAAASRYSRPLRVLYAEHHATDIDLTQRHLARYAPHVQLTVVNTAAEVLHHLATDIESHSSMSFASGSHVPARPAIVAGAARADAKGVNEAASNFDLLLLDYRLPGMNALDLLKELEYLDAPKLPVVLVTGQGDEEVAVQALRLGITDYLVKNPGYLFQLPRTLENTYTQTLLQRERAALFESEQRYRSLFELAPVAIFTKDTSGVYTSANALANDVAGREMVDYTDHDIFDADIAEHLVAHDKKVYENDEEILYEEHLLTQRGDRYFLSRKSPLRDRRGKINGVMGISLEITERLRAEAAQRENQRRLAQLAEHVDEVIWLGETQLAAASGSASHTGSTRPLPVAAPATEGLDDGAEAETPVSSLQPAASSQKRQLLYVSPAYAQVWGRSVASVYADPDSMSEAIIDEDKEVAQRFSQALVEGNNAYLEFRIKRPNGSIAWVAAQTFPVEDEQGQIYRVAGLARDITERRRSEEHLQQQERLVAVGQMAAGIAHDFNNILAIIMLYTQMLQISVQQPSHQRHLTTIYQQALHAADLVQQILDFSRRSTMERVTMDIVPFIKELVRLWQRTLPENIRLELELGRKPLVISADPSRLQQALVNMAINARDAMPQGGVLRLSVSSMTLLPGQPPPIGNMQAGRWLCIGLGDSGTGIPLEVLPHIFDPFYTTKAPGMGTGLGLAQVYGIVHQLDGFITVESQMGLGAFFTIYFPLVDQPVTAIDDTQTPPPRGQGETILLVEDEAALREAMAEMLTELGYTVLSAENGRQAITLYGENQSSIDIVVSDLVMPDMGGKELYQELMLAYRDGPLRMLLVTGYPHEELAQWQVENGKIAWLQKPFAMETFAHRVAETLHGGATVDEQAAG